MEDGQPAPSMTYDRQVDVAYVFSHGTLRS